MLFEPATTMRWRVEQSASAIMGSTILSPVATRGEDITSPVFVRSRPSGADRGLVEIDSLRSGKASVLSITPFVGLQTACHARLLDSHGPISSGRDLISRALQPRFYMSRIRSAMSIAFATSYTLLRRDICGWAALFRF